MAPHRKKASLAVADVPSADDREEASEKSLNRMWKFVRSYTAKSGTFLHPQPEITEALVIGLAKHVDEFGRPLCPCNFYEDKAEEVKSSTWICPCDEMQKWKYCH